MNGVAPGGQENEEAGEQQQPQQQIENRFMGRPVLHGDDDADDEQREGHAQQQSVEFTAFGEKRGKDAVERGHNELAWE